MIIHTVAWGFKPEVTPAEARSINEGIAQGAKAPMTRSFALGENLDPKSKAAFPYLYVATFDDHAAAAAFQTDPTHVTASPRLVAAAAQLLVLDLEAQPNEAPAPGKRSLRHIVAWRFAEGTTPVEESAVIEGLRGTGVVKPTRSMAAGANVGSSAYALGFTHLYVGTWDDVAGLEEFREDTVHHLPAGTRLRQHVAEPATAFDVLG